MPNPKHKHTRAHRDARRASCWRLESAGQSTCTNCKKVRPPHSVCPHCGFYNGKLVVAPKVKKDKSKGAQSSDQEKGKE